MIRTVIATMFLMVSLTSVFADDVGRISFKEYLEWYLEQSAALDAAGETAEDALNAYEDAQAAGESSYELDLLESTYRYREMLVLRVENEEIIAAVQLVFDEAASHASSDLAAMAESLAEEEYARTAELHAKQYASERDLLVARVSELQAAIGTHSAVSAHARAHRALSRPVDETLEDLRIVMFEIPEEFPNLRELSWIVDQDADVTHLRTNLDLYRRRLEHIRDSDIVLPAEQESLEQSIDNAERSLQERIWLLEDTYIQIVADIDFHPQLVTAANMNKRIAALDLEVARYQYAQGDLHASDVLQAELTHAANIEELAGHSRSWHVLILESLKLMGEDLREWIGGL